jgi:hypothetical protein
MNGGLVPDRNNKADLRKLFEEGHFNILQELLSANDLESVATYANKAELFQIVLATGAYGYLATETLQQWLTLIPTNVRPDLRYRALIAAGLLTKAAKFRRGVSETLCMRVSPCAFGGSFVEPFWV